MHLRKISLTAYFKAIVHYFGLNSFGFNGGSMYGAETSLFTIGHIYQWGKTERNNSLWVSLRVSGKSKVLTVKCRTTIDKQRYPGQQPIKPLNPLRSETHWQMFSNLDFCSYLLEATAPNCLIVLCKILKQLKVIAKSISWSPSQLQNSQNNADQVSSWRHSIADTIGYIPV